MSVVLRNIFILTSFILASCTTQVESIVVDGDRQFYFLTEDRCSVSDVEVIAGKSYWLSFEYHNVKDWNIETSSPPMVSGEACNDEQRDDFDAAPTGFSELGFCSNSCVMTSSEWLQRESQANWFEVVLSSDQCAKKTRFNIHKSETRIRADGVVEYLYIPDDGGNLSIFINDLWLMYFNNKGGVLVNITNQTR